MNARTESPTKLVLVGLGSNIEPEKNIPAALRQLGLHSQVVQISSIWQTPAVGSTGADYLNAAAQIRTDLELDDFTTQILSRIENDLGRVRQADKYADRTIDLDVLVFHDTPIDPELWTRAHVAVPAAEICPQLTNPHTGEKLSQAAARLLPGTRIHKRPDLA